MDDFVIIPRHPPHRPFSRKFYIRIEETGMGGGLQLGELSIQKFTYCA
jgi:hypothetical protein